MSKIIVTIETEEKEAVKEIIQRLNGMNVTKFEVNFEDEKAKKVAEAIVKQLKEKGAKII